MIESEDLSAAGELAYEHTGLMILIRDCERLLEKWKAPTPYQSAASPDAVLAISELKDMLRTQVRAIEKELGEEQLPF
jgi:hypothetical protein